MESEGHAGFPADDEEREELHRRAEQAEDEITELRRRLQEAPGRVRTLEEICDTAYDAASNAKSVLTGDSGTKKCVMTVARTIGSNGSQKR